MWLYHIIGLGKKKRKKEALIVSCKKLTQVNKKGFLLEVGRKRP
jgi:hypothetical protein